jgi:hypothetical protein
MLNRNKQPIDIIWLHMDAMHASYPAAIVAMRVQHENQSSFKLSINLSDDGTEALVKVAGARAGWPVGKSWNAAVKRVFTEADHDGAAALVRDPLWEPPQLDEFE